MLRTGRGCCSVSSTAERPTVDENVSFRESKQRSPSRSRYAGDRHMIACGFVPGTASNPLRPSNPQMFEISPESTFAGGTGQ